MLTDFKDTSPATIVVVGCFDTKGEDFAFLHACLKELGAKVLTINTGILGTTDLFKVDFEAEEVASEVGVKLSELRKSADRGQALEVMGHGASEVLTNLWSNETISGVIGMGGGGGTYITLLAMQKVPFGIPKFCISTVATKDLSRQVGTKDITLMPSIVDVAGLNNISRTVIRQAAGAILGMAIVTENNTWATARSIGISMFGNTTRCVEQCSDLLNAHGFEVLTFHAVGIGGRTLESLIQDGHFEAVLDLTTTELADELCDGICSAGPDRLTAASKAGIPQVVAPGCLDMVNYGHMDTVPERYRDRQLYSWAPDVTLMRTNSEENETLGKELAVKLNQSSGPVTVLLPLKGLSTIGGEGGAFYNPQTDHVLFDAIRKHASESIKIVPIEANINDMEFAQRAVEELLELIE